jgi:hypothetical protein
MLSMKILLSSALVLRRSKFTASGWDWFPKSAPEALALRAQARQLKQVLRMKCPHCEREVRVHDRLRSDSPVEHFEHIPNKDGSPIDCEGEL